MTLILTTEEHPILTPVIAQLRKGRARTHRLAHLAALGLIVERGGLVTGQAQTGAGEAGTREGSLGRVAPDTTTYVAQLDDDELADLFGQRDDETAT